MKSAATDDGDSDLEELKEGVNQLGRALRWVMSAVWAEFVDLSTRGFMEMVH